MQPVYSTLTYETDQPVKLGDRVLVPRMWFQGSGPPERGRGRLARGQLQRRVREGDQAAGRLEPRSPVRGGEDDNLPWPSGGAQSRIWGHGITMDIHFGDLV